MVIKIKAALRMRSTCFRGQPGLVDNTYGDLMTNSIFSHEGTYYIPCTVERSATLNEICLGVYKKVTDTCDGHFIPYYARHSSSKVPCDSQVNSSKSWGLEAFRITKIK